MTLNTEFSYAVCVIYAECHNADCHYADYCYTDYRYADYCYAEYHYADCRYTVKFIPCFLLCYIKYSTRYHDIQHKNNQHNDTNHNNKVT